MPFPASLRDALRAQLDWRRELFDADKATGRHEVELPGALARKYPSAPYEWKWQYVFPAPDFSTDIYTHVLNKGPLGVVSPLDTL